MNKSGHRPSGQVKWGCAIKRSACARRGRAKNREKVLEQKRAYYGKNRKKILEKTRTRYENLSGYAHNKILLQKRRSKALKRIRQREERRS